MPTQWHELTCDPNFQTLDDTKSGFISGPEMATFKTFQSYLFGSYGNAHPMARPNLRSEFLEIGGHKVGLHLWDRDGNFQKPSNHIDLDRMGMPANG